MKKQIIILIIQAMIIDNGNAQKTFLTEGVGFAKIVNTSVKPSIDTTKMRVLILPATVVQNSFAKKSWDSHSNINDTRIKTIISHLYYVNVIILIIIFLTEFLIEQKQQNQYKRKEMRNNVLIGIGMFLISFICRVIVLSSFYFVYSFRLFNLNNSLAIWVLAFFLCDFTHYWYHRTAHGVNWFWTAHSVHHSSKEFNISVSFRQSWMTQFSGHFLFYLWLPLLGFEPVIIYSVITLNLFYQSWLHTELIGKLHPVFEWFFNTPSHHRVHHACNLKYLNKNHGEVLIIWDRLFGTFQEEQEKPTYGLTKNLESQDLSTIMWSDWKSLFAKVFSAGSLKNSINYLIQPPGWNHNRTSDTVKKLRVEIGKQSHPIRGFMGFKNGQKFAKQVSNVYIEKIVKTAFCVMLLVILANNSSAQKSKQISIAFLNTGSAYPFSEFSKLFSDMQHPGVEIGYSFNWKTKNKHDWFQEIKLSYFYHRFVQHGIPLYTYIGYRYKFSNALNAQVALGAGYMQSIPATAKLKLSDNGEYKNDKGIGRSQAVAVLNLGIGYTIHPASKKSPSIFIIYQQFLQMPFVKAYVPILPYNSLLIGCNFPFQAHKKIAS